MGLIYSDNIKHPGGFKYKIVFGPTLPWEVVNWCHESMRTRKFEIPIASGVGICVYLKSKKDLTYALLRWG